MTSKNCREGLWGLGILLIVGLTICSYLILSAVQLFAPHSNKITVKGYSERRLSSDYATWQSTLTSRAPSLTEAFEKLTINFNKVTEFLENQGVAISTLKISPVQTTIYYQQTEKGIQTQEIVGYALTRDLHLHSENVQLVSVIANELTNLIKDGLEIHSYKPQYFYTKIDDLKIAMLGEAAKDAKARAYQLASNSGNGVGRLKSAHQGVFQITPIYSTSVSDYGENDSSSIEKSIKAVVTMEYDIQ